MSLCKGIEKHEYKDAYAIKVGSNLVTNDDGSIDEKFILNLCLDVDKIFRQGDAALIVSSGAIASEPDTTMSDNLRSVIGNPCVVDVFRKIFGILGYKVGVLSVTDDDLKRDVIRNVILEAFERKVILIVNANDGTDDKESKQISVCADNDQLTQNIVLKLRDVITGVIIGFGEKGVMDNNENVIDYVTQSRMEEVLSYAKGGSKTGHGKHGAYTKFSVCGELAKKGIPAMVAPGECENFVSRSIEVMKGVSKEGFGTYFVPL